MSKDENSRYRIRGVVLSVPGRAARAGVRVEAWDRDPLCDDLIGEATTDPAGAFLIVWSPESFMKQFFDRRPDVFFRVFEGEALLWDTRDTVWCNLETPDVFVELRVPAAAPSAPEHPSLGRAALESLRATAGETPMEVATRDPGAYATLLGVATADVRRRLTAPEVTDDPELQKLFGAVSLDGLGGTTQTISDHVRDALAAAPLPEAVRRMGMQALANLDLDRTLDAVLAPDRPIADNGLFTTHLERADMYRVTELAGFENQLAEALDEIGVRPQTLTAQKLELLNEAQVLSTEQTAALGAHANLYQLTGGAKAIAAALKAAAEKEVGRGLRSLRDVAGLSTSQLRDAVADADDRADPVRKDQTLRELVAKLERLYPEEALSARLPQSPPIDDLAADIGLVRNSFGADFAAADPAPGASPDASHLAEDERPAAVAAWRRVDAHMRRFPDLRSVFAEASGTPTATATSAVMRARLLPDLLRLNPERRLLSANTYDAAVLASLSFGDLAADERELALEDLRRTQRLLRVTNGDTDQALRLEAAGVSGALDLVDGAPQTLTEEGRRLVGADRARASNVAVDTALAAGRVVDWYRDAATGPTTERPARSASDIEDDDPLLAEVPGFAHYFGNQDYCQCRECQSIVSATAYFVDLMEFVDRYVTTPFFGDEAASHPLRLRSRREDLWTGVPLSCASTETLVPHLVIVNEIFENYIDDDPGAGPAPDRADVERRVYRTLYERGAELRPSLHGFAQPQLVHLSLVNALLGPSGVDRIDVVAAATSGQSDHARQLAQARLDLSNREFALVSSETDNRDDIDFLTELYRFDIPDRNGQTLAFVDTGAAPHFDAQRLLAPMGITRSELGAVAGTQYVRGSAALEIRSERTEGSLQSDVEAFYGLDRAAADRMHRFVRLMQATPWTAAELDLVLSHLGVAHDEPFPVVDIATLAHHARQLDLSAEELCGLATRLPVRPVGDEAESLFDRLFNTEAQIGREGERWDPTTLSLSFEHPEIGGESGRTLGRLLAGLRIGDAAFRATLLTPGATTLDLDSLSAVFQHATLGRTLGLGVSEVVALVRLSGADPLAPLDGVGALDTRIKRLRQWQQSPFDGDALSRLRGVQSDAAPEVAAVLSEVHAALQYAFGDLVFTELEGVSEAQSRTLIALNSDGLFVPATAVASSIVIPPAVETALGLTDVAARDRLQRALARFVETHQRDAISAFPASDLIGLGGLTSDLVQLVVDANAAVIHSLPRIFEALPSDATQYRLTAAFNGGATVFVPDALFPPDAAGPAAATLREFLLSFDPFAHWAAAIASRLRLSAERLDTLAGLAGFSLADPGLRDALMQSVVSGTPTAEVDRLTTALTAAARLLPEESFPIEALSFIAEETGRPGAVFGMLTLANPQLSDLERLAQYAAVLSHAGDGGLATDALRQLGASPTSPRIDAETLNALDEAAKRDSGTLQTLERSLTLPPDSLAALRDLLRCGELAERLGGANVVTLVAGTTVDELVRATDELTAALHRRYPDEEQRDKVVGPVREAILERKRDALSDYLRRTAAPEQFRADNALYHWFLIDPQMQGCAQTSRVVAANASLQLYVQRCLMGLERSGDSEIVVAPAPDAAEQWEWRKNFRLWQANRYVFLFPESYLLPSLRDNKTELFEAVESELLSRAIDEQAARDAYASYLSKFSQLAELRISGAFHDLSNEEDVLHLFATNRGSPPDHYYRAVSNVHGTGSATRPTRWGPWQRINVQIPVEDVSPVVHRGRLFAFWVEVATRAKKDDSSGPSRFLGYRHKFTLNFTSLRLDGSWTTPQTLRIGSAAHLETVEWLATDDEIAESGLGFLGEEALADAIARAREQLLRDPTRSTVGVTEVLSEYPTSLLWPLFVPEHAELSDDDRLRKPPEQMHLEPRDAYELRGFRWRRPYPHTNPSATASPLLVSLAGNSAFGDADLVARGLRLRSDRSPGFLGVRADRLFKTVADGSSISRATGVRVALASAYWQAELIANARTGAPEPLVGRAVITGAPAGTALQVVNGNLTDGIVDAGGDSFHLHKVPGYDLHILRRIGTTLADRIQALLFHHGIDGVLSTATQEELLAEASAPFDFEPLRGLPDDPLYNKANAAAASGMPDFAGPFGVYYRELLLHLPWRIAEHLNEQRKFEDADRWYRRILDPTKAEEPASPETPGARSHPGVWRYVEFRRHRLSGLSDLLGDPIALSLSEDDPFNPHAIARVRLGAYMRAVWLRYCDNLIDWGDELFARDTRESIGEAAVLYTMAADVLGPRPAELGGCSEPEEQAAATYDGVVARIRRCSRAPLTTLEGFEPRGPSVTTPAETDHSSVAAGFLHPRVLQLALGLPNRDPTETNATSPAPSVAVTRSPARSPRPGWAETRGANSGVVASNMTSMLRQSCVFCIPQSPELLALWDRVEDRLFKIRHCLTLQGIRRQLPLFAPPVDPMLLVRAGAAGLSVDDVLETATGRLPPYRFGALIGKTKEYAAALQSFGSALMGALERRDAEDLAVERVKHQHNISQLSGRIRDREVDAAQAQLEALERRVETVTRRKEQQQHLIEQGLLDAENNQLNTRHTATGLQSLAVPLDLVASALSVFPKIVGVAATTGFPEAAAAVGYAAQGVRGLGQMQRSLAESFAAEASFERRREGWRLELEITEHELRALDKQVAAQRIRLDLAERSRSLQERERVHVEETLDFFQAKFSNLELYGWLSTTLQRLFQEAFTNAVSLLRLAENAYRFERPLDRRESAAGGFWNPGRAGLLAGEKLMAAVRDLERRYMEGHDRGMEIDQAFSLSQIAPLALIDLKQTGECEFVVPEAYFDLSYPGQYRRRIRSARLTIPSITGPYTNVGATLTLLGSEIRMNPGDDRQLVPPTRAVTIATSTAQNDAGVFEVSFRDERYMPFEGAGAVESRWSLRLPKAVRPFDYASINDVILHLSYEAEYDATFADQVEADNGAALEFLTGQTMTRVFSLRQEFSSTFNRLLAGATADNPAMMEITERHFPMWLQGRDLEVERAWLMVDMEGDVEAADLPTFTVSRDGVASEVIVPSAAGDGLGGGVFSFPSAPVLAIGTGRVSLGVSRADASESVESLSELGVRDTLLALQYRIRPLA